MWLLDVGFEVNAVGVWFVVELFLDLFVEFFGGSLDVTASWLVEDHFGDVHDSEEGTFGLKWVVLGVCGGEGLE